MTPRQRIEGVRLLDTDIAGPLRFERCTFAMCTVGGLRRRARVSNVQMENCVIERGTGVTSLWLTDVSVRGLRIASGSPQFVNGTIFERVTIASRISGSFVLSSFQPAGDDDMRLAFAAAAATAYSTMDWALDISAAEVTTELSVRDVPTRLIRRDPSTQGVVGAENVPPDWESIDFGGASFRAVARGRAGRSERGRSDHVDSVEEAAGVPAHARAAM